MKLLFLIGNAAVGKMTVGQQLMKSTNLRLFHNHMSIEPVIEIMGYFDGRISNEIRDLIFKEFASSNNYGMIFTYIWAFDMKSDWDYIEYVKNIFKERSENPEFYCAELVTTKEIRMQRNTTENRLKNKASKRNIEESNQRVINDDSRYRIESLDGEVPFENYIKIDNSNLSPQEVAEIIKNKFNFI
ncbi:MAG: shikimate kinase [Clostridia bacterium]